MDTKLKTTISEKDKKLYQFLNKLYNFEGKIKFFEVDFSKSWWKVFWNKKWSVIFVFTSVVCRSIFGSLGTILLGYIIVNKNFELLFLILVVSLFLEIFKLVSGYIYQHVLSSVQSSVSISSYNFFLKVDPIYHSTKSTGQIQSKIQATWKEFSVMMDILVHQLVPNLISFATVVFILARFSGYLAWVGVISFILISLLTFFGNKLVAKKLTKIWIKKRDKYSAVTTENLYQNALIRSTFSVPEQVKKTLFLGGKAFVSRSVMSFSYNLIYFIIRLFFLISSGYISWYVLVMVLNGQLDPVIATALVITYYSGSSSILNMGNLVASFVESSQNMNDLWEFIQNFGKQTYPVLKTDLLKSVEK